MLERQVGLWQFVSRPLQASCASFCFMPSWENAAVRQQTPLGGCMQELGVVSRGEKGIYLLSSVLLFPVGQDL